MKRKLKFGFIGGGRIADLNALGYFNNEKAEIYAICDVDERIAKKRASEWGCEKYFTDYKKLLELEEIDAVEILTPHHLHREMVLAAAEAGKHISLQKPPALNIKEMDEMIEATKKAGVKFKVFENFVFYPPYVKAKELIEEGAIGEPLTIRIKLNSCGRGGWYVPLKSWAWKLNQAAAGEGPAIFDDGYHKFSIAIDFFGDIDEVFAWIDRSFVYIDSPAAIMWKYKNIDCLGSWESSLSPFATCRAKYYSADEWVELTGTEGVILVTRCTGKLLDIAPLILYSDGQTTYFEDIRCDWGDSFMDSAHHFIDCILEDRVPKLTGEVGKKVLQFALATFKSSRELKPISPDSIVE